MTEAVRLLDTGALLSYAEQTSAHVGVELFECAERQQKVVVSAACMAEAYQQASDDGVHLLDVLADIGPVEIEALTPGDARVTGLIGRRVGRLGLAHTCMLALANSLQVMTTDDEALKVLDPSLVIRLN